MTDDSIPSISFAVPDGLEPYYRAIERLSQELAKHDEAAAKAIMEAFVAEHSFGMIDDPAEVARQAPDLTPEQKAEFTQELYEVFVRYGYGESDPTKAH